MDQNDLIEEIVGRLHGDPDLRALFLGGSLGRSEGDRFSDVDLIAVVEAEAHEGFVARWRSLLDGIAPVVFWNTRQGASTLVNAVTSHWLRCDLFVVAPDRLGQRARATVIPLVDPSRLFDKLPERLPERPPNADRIRFLINEFLRVHGLLTVVVGREEHLTAVQGSGLLRDMLIELMQEDARLPDRGGALHLSRVLPGEDMATLLDLPSPGPDRQEVIDAHLAIAAAFLPRAKRMAGELGLDWPEDFEAATRRHLNRELGLYADQAEDTPSAR